SSQPAIRPIESASDSAIPKRLPILLISNSPSDGRLRAQPYAAYGCLGGRPDASPRPISHNVRSDPEMDTRSVGGSVSQTAIATVGYERFRSRNFPVSTVANVRYPRVHGFSRSSFTPGDRKSTRLNSSHVKISYAVFCLTKK